MARIGSGLGVLVAMCVVAGCSGAQKENGSAAIPAADAARAFQEASTLCQAEGGKLWGKSLCGPLMFADPVTHQAVLNGPYTGAVPEGALYRVDLPADEGLANTSKEMGGQRWTMILWPLPEGGTERAVLMMHESFHRLQPELGLQGSGGLGTNTHLDTREGRVWLRAQFHALAAALRAEGEVRRAALSDALLFEAYRRSLWPEAAEQERGLELNEGLAESTGIDAAIPDPAGRVEAALADLSGCETAPSFVRSFAYGTGPAYALLLDEADPAWRRGVRADFGFGAAVAAACKIPLPTVTTSAAEAALARHGGPEIAAQEEVRQKALDERNARFARLFLDGSTASLALEQMSITFNPKDVQGFGDHGTVYGTLQLSDRWGTLKVEGGAALISKDFAHVSIPVEAGFDPAHPAGEGWTLSLSKGYTLAPDPARPGSFQAVPK